MENKRLLTKIKTNTLKNGGGEFNINGKNPTQGYLCSIKDIIAVIDINDFNFSIIDKIIEENKNILKRKNTYLGTWVENGKIYIDICKNYKTKSYCLKVAKKLRELAILDLKTYTGIDVKWY